MKCKQVEEARGELANWLYRLGSQRYDEAGANQEIVSREYYQDYFVLVTLGCLRRYIQGRLTKNLAGRLE